MRAGFRSLTFWSVAALLGGIGLGVLGHRVKSPVFELLRAVAATVGGVWLAALQLLVLPLALVLMLAAITNTRSEAVGRMTSRAMLLFVSALIAFGVLTILIAQALLGQYQVAPELAASLTAGVQVPAAAQAATAPTLGSWLGGLIPSNLFAAMARGDIFALLLFVLVFGLAVLRLPERQRVPVAAGARALADTMMVLVHWLLLVTPIGVFALGYQMALETGFSLAGVLGVYLLLQPAVTVFWILLLYPLTALAAGIGMRAFARAALPAQLMAAGTRSSAASLPAMVEGVRRHLPLPPAATSFLLPFSVSLFRISEVITNGVKLVFLAQVYDVRLGPGTIAAFLLTVIIFSFSGTGTPNSGGGIGFRMVPVFVAAGMPIQGVILLEVVETIPDVFATVANVTGQMSATTILSRRSEVAVEPVRSA
jgi:proton glutamate symport protein